MNGKMQKPFVMIFVCIIKGCWKLESTFLWLVDGNQKKRRFSTSGLLLKYLKHDLRKQ